MGTVLRKVLVVPVMRLVSSDLVAALMETMGSAATGEVDSRHRASSAAMKRAAGGTVDGLGDMSGGDGAMGRWGGEEAVMEKFGEAGSTLLCVTMSTDQ